MQKDLTLDRGEMIIYTDRADIEVRLMDETVWLSQKQIAVLFDVQRPAVTKHIKNILDSGELVEHSVCSKMEHTASDGKVYENILYNLDMIISVGYRVNSSRATQFRIWATRTLKDHIVKGYTINQKRLAEKGLTDFEEAVKLIKSTIDTRKLSNKETQGLLSVVTDYAFSWVTLQKYDEGTLMEPSNKHIPEHVLNYEDAVEAIYQMKVNLLSRGEASDIFGNERGQMLDAVLGNLYQTWDNQELYPTIEDKASHLLYFIIKDHPFSDGNKRIGSFLFILFLAKNGYLNRPSGEKKINDVAIVAIALLVAESKPEQKDVMITLIMNFLTI